MRQTTNGPKPITTSTRHKTSFDRQQRTQNSVPKAPCQAARQVIGAGAIMALAARELAASSSADRRYVVIAEQTACFVLWLGEQLAAALESEARPS